MIVKISKLRYVYDMYMICKLLISTVMSLTAPSQCFCLYFLYVVWKTTCLHAKCVKSIEQVSVASLIKCLTLHPFPDPFSFFMVE